MRLLAAALITFFAISAQAAPYMKNGTYRCSIEPIGNADKGVEFTFIVKNDELQCQIGDDPDICEQFFIFTPEEQSSYWLEGMYDGGYEINAQGNFDVFADSDGCNIATFELYKNSGYSKGFITSEFRCGAGQTERFAGKVTCEIE